MKFSEMSIQKLKDEFEGYHSIIYNHGCHGTKDLWNYDGIKAELIKRGYDYREIIKWYYVEEKEFEEMTNDELLESYNEISAKLGNYISEKGKKFLNTLEEIIRELSLRDGK